MIIQVIKKLTGELSRELNVTRIVFDNNVYRCTIGFYSGGFKPGAEVILSMSKDEQVIITE